MATQVGKLSLFKPKAGILRTFVLSGSVQKSSVGVVRDILIYKKGSWSSPYTTSSDASGNWSQEVSGSSNDVFLVIVLGKDTDENAQVYYHIVE